MKIVALGALGIMCAMTGQYAAWRLESRVKILEKLKLMLSVIESEIRYLGRPVDEIINILTSKKELEELVFLEDCMKGMKKGKSFIAAWRDTVCGSRMRYLFKTEDREMLMSFGELFGSTDSEGQITNCRIHTEMINERLREAVGNREKYSSLFRGLGILCGVCAAVILI